MGGCCCCCCCRRLASIVLRVQLAFRAQLGAAGGALEQQQVCLTARVLDRMCLLRYLPLCHVQPLCHFATWQSILCTVLPLCCRSICESTCSASCPITRPRSGSYSAASCSPTVRAGAAAEAAAMFLPALRWQRLQTRAAHLAPCIHLSHSTTALHTVLTIALKPNYPAACEHINSPRLGV